MRSVVGLAWLVGCVESPGAGFDGELRHEGLVVSEARRCADPTRRDDGRYDVIELPGDPVGKPKFWGGGVTLGDFDGDGHLDVVLTNPPGLRLYAGDGRGGLELRPSGLDAVDPRFVAGAAAADPDADGDLDLLVSRWQGGLSLLINDGAGTFSDATAEAGLPAVDGYLQAATWGDLDLDGDLDALVAGYGWFDDSAAQIVVEGPATPSLFLENLGDGTFVDASERLPAELHDGYTFVPAIVDLDGDPWPDLYFVNDFPGYVLPQAARGTGDGRFEVLGADSGLRAHVSGMGLAVLDTNDDGLDDLVIPGWGELWWLQSIPGTDRWVDMSLAWGTGPGPDQHFGWGAEAGDLDLDGEPEVYTAWGFLLTSPFFGQQVLLNPLWQPDTVHSRDAEGRWHEVAAEWGLDDPGIGRGVAFGDLDEDGWLDVVTPDLAGPTRVSLSRCGGEAWLAVTLEDPGPNRFGVGATVRVRAGERGWTRRIRAGGTSHASQGPAEAHFGLADLELVDLEVTWPDGEVSSWDSVPTRRRVVARR